MKNLFFPARCDEFSNCPLGNSKEVKKCTVDSPRVCDGCQDGNYLNPSTGCQTCSPPCRFDQDETTPCTTEHDRTCAPKTTVSTTSTISKSRVVVVVFFVTSLLTEDTRSTKHLDLNYCLVDMILESTERISTYRHK